MTFQERKHLFLSYITGKYKMRRDDKEVVHMKIGFFKGMMDLAFTSGATAQLEVMNEGLEEKATSLKEEIQRLEKSQV